MWYYHRERTKLEISWLWLHNQTEWRRPRQKVYIQFQVDDDAVIEVTVAVEATS